MAGAKYKDNKPEMEKKRRSRINESLSCLKLLVLGEVRRKNTRISKLDKADILEMAVEYVQRMHLNSHVIYTRVDKYRAGFNACAEEVRKHLAQAPEVDIDVRTRVVDHLANFVQNLQWLRRHDILPHDVTSSYDVTSQGEVITKHVTSMSTRRRQLESQKPHSNAGNYYGGTSTQTNIHGRDVTINPSNTTATNSGRHQCNKRPESIDNSSGRSSSSLLEQRLCVMPSSSCQCPRDQPRVSGERGGDTPDLSTRGRGMLTPDEHWCFTGSSKTKPSLVIDENANARLDDSSDVNESQHSCEANSYRQSGHGLGDDIQKGREFADEENVVNWLDPQMVWRPW